MTTMVGMTSISTAMSTMSPEKTMAMPAAMTIDPDAAAEGRNHKYCEYEKYDRTKHDEPPEGLRYRNLGLPHDKGHYRPNYRYRRMN